MYGVSLTKGCLVLPYRLVLTLTPLCGPQACPQASPPFPVENRKLWLHFLHASGEGRGEHPVLVDLP